MNGINNIREQHQYITRLICRPRLKEAIFELNELLTKISDWQGQSKLEEVETAYTYMLEYMRQNVDDPERRALQYKLIRDMLAIADQAKLKLIATDKLGNSYTNAKEKLQKEEVPIGLEHMQIILENHPVPQTRERLHELMFFTVWTNPGWTPEEEAPARRILNSKAMRVNDICLFVSAVTLSLIENFDTRKALFLFDAYTHQNNQISQRALVGLVILFQLYHTRLIFYPEIVARISLLGENEKFEKDLSRVQIQMLRSKDTDKINQKMQNEIIPEMIKNANAHNMRINPDDNGEETDDFNPDWAEQMENSPLADKLREMSELQMEGADVYMSTFAYHKGYPFFHKINNWFYPFDKTHSLVTKELSEGTGSKVIDLILESAFFCDSDKYSLLFTIMRIPQAHREMMTQQLSEQQIDDLMNEEKSNSIKKFSDSPEIVSNQYIHNLYRFFKLYTQRHEFQDIFNEPLRLHEYPVLKSVMSKPHLLKELGEFCFHKEHYPEAIEIYQALLDLQGGQAEIYQKLGFCYQKLKDFDHAIKAFLKADVLKPDNVWTNRHLATCYRMINEYGKAIQYYKKVEQAQPENRSLLFNTGSCYVELEQYDEAVQYFFKLDFIEPDNIRTWRAIAWCLFIVRKYEQAMKYYERILEKNGVAPDFLNTGHVAWCMGDMKKARELYQQACKLAGSKTLFLDIFNKDKEYLIKNGIDEYDIALMYDLLQ